MGSPKASQLRLGDGVYDEVDGPALEKHIVKLLEAGVAGIVVHGSNGECAHLSPSERTTIIRVARDTIIHEASGTRVPLIAGCGAQSTRETTELCEDAGKAGATHALLLRRSSPDDLIIQHFYAVADKSPIPILVYNFPGAAAGRDLSSDTILSIAKHPNVVGVKLTCGNTGKLARIVADCPEGFFVGGGSADFILQGHAVGGNGTISGLANLCPRACVRITELADEGNWKEARQLQAKVAKADWMAIKTGFVGVKAALGHFGGYGGEPRRPCVAPSQKELDTIAIGFQEVMDLETTL
ncbi:putative 4-hydroxy-2-oxoglutarate aldolase, mitochondrial [Fusarium culmorum]|uniref:Putative 4-hydroxy-2-oxoglutarate aldolase, mitochondrial n=1 Tax=Fusarium culmorum TaxID=5516 RepID=A0A2T4GKN5_FUSCU|nr:putative 4-hydroxy-2-oxoglutarate aldolase, mitochondrial [Fusarium culmorum]